MNEIMKVVEIFHSIQGEGLNQGMAAVFIRLAGCNMACKFCDTDWTVSTEMTVWDILDEVSKYNCGKIIWTGGEPTLQLTDDILTYFGNYINHIETNGTGPVPRNMNYVSCSPKGLYEIKTRMGAASEFRFPIRVGDSIPNINKLPYAANYYLSPIFEGANADQFSQANVDYCVDAIKGDQRWKLSIQMHKLLSIR